jgi:hypothetical protein
MEAYLKQSQLEELSFQEMILIDGGGFFKDLWAGFKDGFSIALIAVILLMTA